MPVEPAEFRMGQRSQWNTAAAGWKRWSPLIDAGARPVSERLVDLAGIEWGHRVLDVAAGYGEPALAAARRAGSEGEVVATDIAAEMSTFGRERAAGGFSDVEVEEIDVLFDYSSPEEFVACLRDIAPPITALLAQYPPDVQNEAWAAITAAARERAGGDGPLTLSNQALLAVGEA